MIDCRLYIILHERKMTQLELVKMTGLSQTTISALVSGKSKQIRYDTLDRICKALEVTPGDILHYKKSH
ncbi:helix-turn-helix domain-containing protein [Enterococcus cecorum]|nr:helix-turn-helix domain-containing protein [Enterococcus cecorum]CAI3404292.1 helix-turn-helix domain-containing protein [Enterococcus cecorum]CAI3413006.1 helix-turn-helix domain-containing protein [Enterococcus cecorum]CAI3445346.1 helix-turn-helix domain-containing protein [Enterococcus cecorum]CAI3474041.1 helix-turn-helix domain-containing protein [Enterococcus cecorum]